MSLLVDIPPDVLLELLSDWLGRSEYKLLDTAVSNASYRIYFLKQLQLVPMNGNSCSKPYINWIYKRKFSLKSIYLGNNFPREKFLELNLSKVSFVHLFDDNLDEVTIKVINACKSIESLDCILFPILEHKISANFISQVSIFKQLRMLSIEYRRLDVDFYDNILFHIGQCTQLEDLTLTDYETGQIDLYKTIFMNNRNLKCLKLSSTTILSLLSECCPQLKDVEINTYSINIEESIAYVVANSDTLERFFTLPFRYLRSAAEKTIDIFCAVSDAQLNHCVNGIHNLTLLLCAKKQTIPLSVVENNYSTLHSLVVPLSTISEELLFELLTRCKQLKVLNFQSLGFVSYLPSMLWELPDLVLTDLQIIDSLVRISQIIPILKNCSQLRVCAFYAFSRPTKQFIKEFKKLLSESGRQIECRLKYYYKKAVYPVVFVTGDEEFY